MVPMDCLEIDAEVNCLGTKSPPLTLISLLGTSLFVSSCRVADRRVFRLKGDGDVVQRAMCKKFPDWVSPHNSAMWPTSQFCSIKWFNKHLALVMH